MYISSCVHVVKYTHLLVDVPASNNVNISVPCALREDEGGQVNSTLQHPCVRFHLEWGRFAIVQSPGHISCSIWYHKENTLSPKSMVDLCFTQQCTV